MNTGSVDYSAVNGIEHKWRSNVFQITSGWSENRRIALVLKNIPANNTSVDSDFVDLVLLL